MIQKMMMCLAIASLAFVAPRAAAAPPPITHVFVTVDTVQTYYEYEFGLYNRMLAVTGIRAGASAPTTTVFNFGPDPREAELFTRCERYALMAAAKPGKLKLGIGTNTSPAYVQTCQLLQVTP